jgi:hypothetical protein
MRIDTDLLSDGKHLDINVLSAFSKDKTVDHANDKHNFFIVQYCIIERIPALAWQNLCKDLYRSGTFVLFASFDQGFCDPLHSVLLTYSKVIVLRRCWSRSSSRKSRSTFFIRAFSVRSVHDIIICLYMDLIKFRL